MNVKYSCYGLERLYKSPGIYITDAEFQICIFFSLTAFFSLSWLSFRVINVEKSFKVDLYRGRLKAWLILWGRINFRSKKKITLLIDLKIWIDISLSFQNIKIELINVSSLILLTSGISKLWHLQMHWQLQCHLCCHQLSSCKTYKTCVWIPGPALNLSFYTKLNATMLFEKRWVW